MYTLDCSYYKKEFKSLQDLIDDCLQSGMDPNYEVLKDGEKIGNELIDFL